MEAKKAHQDCTEYWLARTAIFWIKNQREEALKAWEHGNALSQRLPQAGAYEFDRSLFAEVRKALDRSPDAREPVPISSKSLQNGGQHRFRG